METLINQLSIDIRNLSTKCNSINYQSKTFFDKKNEISTKLNALTLSLDNNNFNELFRKAIEYITVFFFT